MRVFRQTVLWKRGAVCHEEEPVFGGADRRRLKQAELGMAVPDLIRQLGISEQTFYRWKKLYAGLQPDQARELKQPQDENAPAEEAGGRAELGRVGSRKGEVLNPREAPARAL